ncbi:hypothetical protein TSUD_30530 [Trifolium subterraneum]|uniref:Uncharacterized protein n=1 Tax=Trifolium subterraneum TaxID=3900 RepID=A0A2Z6MXA9_TRISU|nr:hypothetical protein TSUD_30530 [Trifolium subterraneum]
MAGTNKIVPLRAKGRGSTASVRRDKAKALEEAGANPIPDPASAAEEDDVEDLREADFAEEEEVVAGKKAP